MDYNPSDIFTNSNGDKLFELSNHLGNVLAVVSDKISAVSGSVVAFSAEVVHATDYYPFGMGMPDRQFVGGYRYGFNGKEKDDEGMGGGHSTYDYGFRIYNPAIAKFLSVDPLTASYPWYTPYQFAGNKPVAFIDLDGAEELYYLSSFEKSGGETIMWLLKSTDIGEQVTGEFQNINPDKFEGRVNLGYDIFIMRKSYVNVGRTVTHGTTRVMFDPGFSIRGTDDEGIITVRLDGSVALAEALDKREGLIYERLKQNYPIELLENENFKNSIRMGRGIILVGIAKREEPKSDLEAYRQNLEDSESLGHEIGSHAIDASQGNTCSEIEDHGYFTGSWTETTFVMPGSKQDKLFNELQNVVPEKLNKLAKYIYKL